MKIPVFVSAPSVLNKSQSESLQLIYEQICALQLEPRSLGKGDYPTELPLREVYTVAKHCAGGVILGFAQFETESGVWKRETPNERIQCGRVAFSTPWNQLEAGILFGLRLPLLIFRDREVGGGVFDPGVTDVFIHRMPIHPLDRQTEDALKQIFLKWASRVREVYYAD